MFAMTPKSRVVFVHALNELKKDIAPVVKGLLVNHSLAIKPEGASSYAYLMCTVVLDEELPWIAAAHKQPVLQAPIDLNGTSQMRSGGNGTDNGDRAPIDDATPTNQSLLPSLSSTRNTTVSLGSGLNGPTSNTNDKLLQTTTNTFQDATITPCKPVAPRPKITKPRPKPAEQGSGALKRALVQSGESSEENEHVAKRARPAPRNTGLVDVSSSPLQTELPASAVSATNTESPSRQTGEYDSRVIATREDSDHQGPAGDDELNKIAATSDACGENKNIDVQQSVREMEKTEMEV